jgi:hypothetical protein
MIYLINFQRSFDNTIQKTISSRDTKVPKNNFSRNIRTHIKSFMSEKENIYDVRR